MPEYEYASLKDKMRAEKIARQARYAKFEAAYAEADRLACAAVEDMVPTPMIVAEHVNPLDDNSPIKRIYAPVEGGVCGFAWVKVHKGTTSLAKWLVANKGFRKSYYGGLELSVRGYGQSMERKEAYARAFAAHMNAALETTEVYATSRMD